MLIVENCVPLKGSGSASSNVPTNAPTSAPASNSKCTDTKQNLDYFGNDLCSAIVSGDINTQFTQCTNLCSSTANCAGFTLVYNQCFMKYKLENATYKAAALSATCSQKRYLRSI